MLSTLYLILKKVRQKRQYYYYCNRFAQREGVHLCRIRTEIHFAGFEAEQQKNREQKPPIVCPIGWIDSRPTANTVE